MVNVYPQAIIDAALANIAWERSAGFSERDLMFLRSCDVRGMTTDAARRMLRSQCPDRMTEEPARRRGGVSRFYFSAEVTRAFYEMARA